MGLMDRLREMFGDSRPEADEPQPEEIEEELAIEGVQGDIEAERDAAIGRYIETPSTLDDQR